MAKNTSGKNVSLTPEMEQFIQQKIDSGFYGTASEVIRAGIRLLKEQDDLLELQREQLKGKLLEGQEDIKQGRMDTVSNVRQRLKKAQGKKQ